MSDLETDRQTPPVLDGGKRAERARCVEIITLAHKHQMPQGFAAQHIESGTSLGIVRDLVLTHAALKSENTAISGRSPARGDEGVSASWDRALLRAGATL